MKIKTRILRRLHHQGLPVRRCPSCFYQFDTHLDLSHGSGQLPSPGAFGICLSCAALLVYNADLSLRLAEPSELDQLDVHQCSTIKAAQDVIRQRGPLA